MNGSRDTPKWWQHPGRHCLNDFRFTHRTTGKGAKTEMENLLYLCMTCPVMQACHAEAESYKDTRYPTTGVVQGGKLWT